MWKWTQRSFAGGQQDQTLAGRQDLASYFTSARTLENFIVKRQGCISKRRGTNLVAQLGNIFGKDDSGNSRPVVYARIIPFVYEREGGFMLLFASTEYEETTTTDGETTTVTKTASKVFILSSQGVLVTRTTTETADDGTVTESTADTWTEVIGNGDTPVSIDIPYAGSDFNAIGYTQSGDVLWLAHPAYPFARIEKDFNNQFSYSEIDFVKAVSGAVKPPVITGADMEGDSATGSTRDVAYVATAVKNGLESAPSNEVFVTYHLPWSDQMRVKITLAKGANEEEPDFYNIYKKSGGEFGFIASTGDSKAQVFPTLRPIIYNDDGTVKDTGDANKIFIPEMRIVNTYAENTSAYFTGVISETGLRKDLFFSGGASGVASSEKGWVFTLPIGGFWTKTARMPIKLAKGCGATIFTFSCGIANGITSYKRVSSREWFRHGFYGKIMPRQTSYVVKATYSDGSKDQTYYVAVSVAPTVEQTVKYLYRMYKYKYTDEYIYVYFSSNEAAVAAMPTLRFSADFTEEVQADFPDGIYWVTDIEVISGTLGENDEITEGEPGFGFSECIAETRSQMSNYVYDDYITPDTSLTPPSIEPHFNKSDAYPACVSLQNQRLALGATNAQPFTLWMSVTGDLYNFNTHSSIREDDAIEATVPATEFPEINHIVAAKEMLLMCDNGEWVVSPVSGNTLSYKTIQIKQQSRIGCSKRLPPLPVADEIIFSESTNETLRSIRYDFTTDGYQSVDLSVLSQSLTRNNPIVDYAYKQHPDSIIVCVREDGTLATLTYMKEHELCAWSTTVLGGDMKAIGVSTDKAIRGGTTDLYILAEHPLIEEEEDDPWLDASSKIDGTLLLLRVREDGPTDTVENSLCLDAMHIVTAEAGDTIPTGRVAIDLKTGEQVTALTAGERYAVGYPYAATFRSIPPEAQGESTIQFEIKGAKSAELRLENASAFKIVPTALENEDENYWTTCGDDVIVTPPETPPGDEEEEQTSGKVTFSKQDHLVDLAGDANTSGAITIKSDSVWPMTLLSYSVNFEFDPRLLGQKG